MDQPRTSDLVKLAAQAPLWLGLAAVSAPATQAAETFRQDSRRVIYEDEPRLVWLPPAIEKPVDTDRWVRVAKGAIIARERVWAPQAQLRSDLPILLPERLGGDLGPASQLSRRFKAGREDACLMRGGASASEAFVQVCLADTDRDGLYDLASRGDEAIAIAPVRLLPADAPDEAISRIARVLDVTALDGTMATLRVYYVIRSGGNYCSVGPGEGPAPRTGAPRPPHQLLLRQNGSATIEGLRLTMRKAANGDWWMNARGSFPAWASLTEHGTVIKAGGKTDCIR